MSRIALAALVVVACGDGDPVAVPAPTGPLAVARATVRWTDPGRDEPMTDAPSDRREVTVHLWYPSASRGTPAPYVEGLPALRSVLDDESAEMLGLVTTHTTAGAPPADGPAFPLVLFSPGNGMLSGEYAGLIEDLASHGFAVAAINHPYDARAVVLEDGRAVPFLERRWPPLPPPSADGRPDESSEHATFYRGRAAARAADARFVLDRLALPDAPLAGRLDLARVGFVGHSVGGVAAGDVCRGDPRVVACVNLDGESPGGPYYRDASAPLPGAYLVVTKPFVVPDAQLARWGLTRERWVALRAERDQLWFATVKGGSRRVVIDGATHGSFSDNPFVFAALEDEDTSAHARRTELVRRHVGAFLRSVLRRDAAAPAEPGVTVESWPPVTP